MNNIKIENLVRISKKTARSMYERYYTVEIIPRLINPRSMWMQGYKINDLNPVRKDFDHVVNEYQYYNCNKETGLYVAFYVNEADLVSYRTVKNNGGIKE